MEINKCVKHGFAASVDYKAHFYQGLLVGCEIFAFHNADLNWKSHYINGQEIGCTKYNNKQYYYNKSSKKFGEEIKWKWIIQK